MYITHALFLRAVRFCGCTVIYTVIRFCLFAFQLHSVNSAGRWLYLQQLNSYIFFP